MKTTDNGRDARSRATRRLRNLTVGTAVLGVVATGGFSALAAATTHDGPATTAPTTSTTTTASTSTATAAPVVTAASGPGVVTTGGS
jgi:hypothetical protein